MCYECLHMCAASSSGHEVSTGLQSLVYSLSHAPAMCQGLSAKFRNACVTPNESVFFSKGQRDIGFLFLCSP